MENPRFVDEEREARLLSLRLRMVDEQLVGRGVSDAAVLAAMRSVPRHLFVESNQQTESYADHPVAIGFGQTISQPYIVAYMLSALELCRHHVVLEIGTGCGYLTALLAEIVSEVYSIEILPALLYRANLTLDRLGYKNIHTMLGDGTLGWASPAHFDAIIVSAAIDHIPEALVEQLSPHGRMILPVVKENDTQQLVLVSHSQTGISCRELLEVRFVPMRQTGLV